MGKINQEKMLVISNIQLIKVKLGIAVNQKLDNYTNWTIDELRNLQQKWIKQWNWKLENPVPYINLNGNDEETIKEELYETAKLINDASKSLCKMQMFHGRNSTDNDHMQRLREKKLSLNKSLNEVYKYLEYVANEL